jgi:hypothetical protein
MFALLALTSSVPAARAQSASAVVQRLPTIAQVQYGGGGDWYANPSSLPNLLKEIRTRTGIPVAERPVQVKLGDANVFSFPYLYITGHGNIKLEDLEIANLRRYLESGGFLHVDDNYGLDESFRREIKRVFPEKDLVELPLSHPVFHIFYDFPRGVPKIHEHDGKPAQAFGLFHNGRLVLFYSYQTDLGDGWEDAAVHNDPPAAREAALRMGINLFLYAMSQEVS